MIELVNPDTKIPLIYNESNQTWFSKDGLSKFNMFGNTIKFLNQNDNFYEGAYLNNIKYNPKSKFFILQWPLWLISNGYLWEVKKQFKKDSILLELGCASGVNYFGERFNMIGLDLSFSSLQGLKNYKFGLHADATKIPLADNSVDGVISSYFWEHIPPKIKDEMLIEFKRVLKPNGKIVFLYDIETNNAIINLIKKDNPTRYKELFLDKDGHLGYESYTANQIRFRNLDYIVVKHFGMERTWLQSNSVYEKLRHINGWVGFIGKTFNKLTSAKYTMHIYIFLVRLVDCTIGKLFPINKSRIIITVLKVKK